jgi:Domain of unknown function (DUF4156)
MKYYFLVLVGVVATLSGCAAIQATPEASAVELVNDKPRGCKALGEVAGSQGNWLTGDYTSNENLMLGARNELRNKAAAKGGNVVYVQNLSHTNAWGSLGTTNTTIVGQVYSCDEM